MLHYLPGCDVKKNHKEACLRVESYMQSHQSLIDQCCRVTHQFLKDNETIVNNCTMCDIILRESHPTSDVLSLYEYILSDQHFPFVDHHGEHITIQDCFRTRENTSLQNAVRECLKRMNFTIVELDDNRDQSKYCGVWLNNEPSKECIRVAPNTFKNIIDYHLVLLPYEEQVKRMKENLKRYKTKTIVVYCNGCEKGIKLGGGQPLHMIELIAKGL